MTSTIDHPRTPRSARAANVRASTRITRVTGARASLSQRLLHLFRPGRHRINDKSEADTYIDSHTANSRALGGVEDPTATDQASTTGTSPTESFVGRVAGDDIGSFEEQGAERRAAADD